MNNQSSILQQQVDIVLAQLKAASPTLNFYVGDENGQKKIFTKKEMIEHVTSLDAIGKQFVQTQVDFMKALQNGDFQKVLMA
jgi:hypothetical protein